MKVHENYNTDTSDNDIALIQIEGRIKFSEYVESICIPSQGYEFDTNLKCFAAGWGDTRFRGEASLELREVEVSCPTDIDCILNIEYLLKAAAATIRFLASQVLEVKNKRRN